MGAKPTRPGVAEIGPSASGRDIEIPAIRSAFAGMTGPDPLRTSAFRGAAEHGRAKSIPDNSNGTC